MLKKEDTLMRMSVLAMRGMVLFPQMVLHFDVGRDKSILALNEAMGEGRLLFLSAQKDIRDEDPTGEQLYKIGVVAEIKQIIKSKGHLRVLVEGKYRARIVKLVDNDPYLTADIEAYPMKSHKRGTSAQMLSALMRTLKDLFSEYGSMTPRMTKDLVFSAMGADDPLFLSEYIAANLPIHIDDKQQVLEESSVVKRLQLLIRILEEENDLLSLEHEIHEKVRDQIDTNQREYYLREQMKAISQELGEGEAIGEEAYEYHERIAMLGLEPDTEEKLHKEVDRLVKMPSSSHESALLKTYLDTVLELPWNKLTKDKTDIVRAEKQLNRDHYALDKVKERILELIAVRALAPDQRGQIICLAGPPGVGKTSIAKSVAKAMNRNYVRMSLGGVRDESDIRGHRKTYIGAMPGRIINAVSQAKSANPLLLLDEIDKLGSDFRGDPSAALLEVLDSEQNFAFRDHYIEVPFDLSRVLFLATANDLGSIPRPLLDRMEIIELSSYTREEKFHIGKKYLVPKQLKKHGLTTKQLKIPAVGLYCLIDSYTREAGVRSLERRIAALCRKAAKKIVAQEQEVISITPQSVQEYLGPYKFKPDDIDRANSVGLVNGLAWTSVGGELLQVEVAVLEGTGKLELTGSLGKVMQESAKAAISYIRSTCEKYGIDKDFYKNRDIHIHFPEGAVPKDGPSAGITMCTALVSALSGVAVRGDVAMTGEISLRGRVLPIGGLKEKSMAAFRNGIKTVIIPESNVPDLDEIDKAVRAAITFVPAKHVETVLELALAASAKARAKIPAISLEYEKSEDSETTLLT